jgi:hypothetical protein
MHISTNFGNIYNMDSYYKLETKILSINDFKV